MNRINQSQASKLVTEDGQGQTDTDRDRQGQTRTDRDGQGQTRTEKVTYRALGSRRSQKYSKCFTAL